MLLKNTRLENRLEQKKMLEDQEIRSPRIFIRDMNVGICSHYTIISTELPTPIHTSALGSICNKITQVSKYTIPTVWLIP